MDKRLVIQAQQAVNACLGSTHVGFRQWNQLAVFADGKKFKRACTAGFARALAQHPIDRAFLLEIELHVHVVLTQVDKLLITPGARFAP